MSEKMRLPRSESCFVCGDPARNGSALQLQAYHNNGTIEAEFVPRQEHQGFPGIVHGGILVSLLDEVSSWAASFAAKCFCVTRDFSVKFHKQAAPGERILLSAKVIEVRQLITVEAKIMNALNEKIASSSGRFYPTLQAEWDNWMGSKTKPSA